MEREVPNLLLDAYRMDHLVAQWNWFANGSWDQPVLTRGGYRPGSEVDAVAGTYFDGWKFGDVKVALLAQVIGSYRLHDEGPAAMPDDTGYERILLSPGIEVETAGLGIYADVGFPVFEHVRGNQLVASALFKINVSYSLGPLSIFCAKSCCSFCCRSAAAFRWRSPAKSLEPCCDRLPDRPDS